MSDTEGRPARRTQAERRAEAEQRLLAAAADLVAAGGVRAVTLAAVGQAAGYSRGIVSHHFGSRRGLLERLVISLQDRYRTPDAGPDGDRGLAWLLALVESYLADLVTRERDARAFLVLWAEALTGEADLRPLFADRDERFRAMLADALEHARTQGTVRQDVDGDAMATALVGLLRGIALQLVLGSLPSDAGAVRREAVALVERGLRAGPATQPLRGEPGSEPIAHRS